MVFVGYQAEGSLGRRLLDGVDAVKLFGETIAVRARIVNFKGLSSHADRSHLIGWLEHFSPKPRETFVVHGDAEVTETYATTLRDRGLSAHAPNPGEVYDLAAGIVLSPGQAPAPRQKSQGSQGSPAFRRLEETGRMLLELIARSRGRANKDLAKLSDQLRAVMEKWDK